ncbi:hypothetical protein PC110_g9711 [Phytophthora cactorum]|nr:hypothetical protein PC114_g9742 [Phytophthora cactorum]RAW33975.1 hypothetical protein PC110_g9711 [Phytophthora cactorum]
MSTEMNPSLSSVASTLGWQRQRRSLWTKHVFWLPMCRALPTLDLQESLSSLAAQSKYVPTVRMNPSLLYAKLPRDYRGSAKTGKYGGYGSCSWILWRLPEWKIVIAVNAYLSSTTINLAEYTGMNNGVKTAIAHGAKDLVIVGDSRLAIQQSLGVIACRQESLLALLNVHKELAAKLRSV